MKSQRGFSLIELMIVVTVIAILGTLAVSSYRQYVLRANRAEAWSALLQVQTGEEKYYMQNTTYTADLTPTGLGLSLNGALTLNGNYTITVVPTACAAGATSCTYVATATATGTQVKDLAACQVYTINSSGLRTPADTTGCWR